MKAYLTATRAYRPIPGGSAMAREAYWRVTGNTSPDPETWRGPADVDGETFDAAAMTQAAESLGYADVSGWEWLPLNGIYRATGIER